MKGQPTPSDKGGKMKGYSVFLRDGDHNPRGDYCIDLQCDPPLSLIDPSLSIRSGHKAHGVLRSRIQEAIDTYVFRPVTIVVYRNCVEGRIQSPLYEIEANVTGMKIVGTHYVYTFHSKSVRMHRGFMNSSNVRWNR